MICKSECFVCLRCIDDCLHDALSFGSSSQGQRGRLSRRRYGRRDSASFGALRAAILLPMARLSGGVKKNFQSGRDPSPGLDWPKTSFYVAASSATSASRSARPTSSSRPIFEAGVEGLWTPIMISKMGWCELELYAVQPGPVPTDAIREISIAEKLGSGPFEGKGPVKTGTAFYNRGRHRLPWAMDVSCVVCEEVCPVSPRRSSPGTSR